MSLGTLDDTKGKIEYDGGNQNILSDTYYDLELDQNGDKLAQGDINVNGELTVQNSSALVLGTNVASVTGKSDINGELTISTGTFDANGTFDATSGDVTFSSSGQLLLGGTLTDLGNFTESTSKVVFDGSSAQTIPDAESFYDLQVNGAGVSTTKDISILGTLHLGNGNISVSGYNKEISIYSSTSGGSGQGHIVGPVKYNSSFTTPCTIDLGDGTNWRPIIIEPNSTSSTSFEVEYKIGYPGLDINYGSGLQYANTQYHYFIDRSGSSDAYISLPLYGLNKDVDPTALCIADYDDSFSQDWWEKIPATSTPNNGGGNPFTITDFVRGFVNTFSSSHEEFTVGSTNQPLGGDPFILTSGSLSSFYACSAAVSLEQSFQLSAINLEDTVFLNAPTGYELSKSAHGPYFNTIFYEGINGGISNTNVYVRLIILH